MPPGPLLSRPLVLLTVILAAAAAAILLAYLARRRPLAPASRVWLLFGIAVLPALALLTGNLAAYDGIKRRAFCGSCHTMAPYLAGTAEPGSTALAAVHSHNDQFGDQSCYHCHRDYRLFGGVRTKVTGLRHLFAYYVRHPDSASLYRPYSNANCTQCHSMMVPGFAWEPEHAAVADDLRRGATSCVAAGCHGPAHGEREAKAP